MKTNIAEKIFGWHAGTLKISIKNGQLKAIPYLLKPNEVQSYYARARELGLEILPIKQNFAGVIISGDNLVNYNLEMEKF